MTQDTAATQALLAASGGRLSDLFGSRLVMLMRLSLGGWYMRDWAIESIAKLPLVLICHQSHSQYQPYHTIP